MNTQITLIAAAVALSAFVIIPLVWWLVLRRAHDALERQLSAAWALRAADTPLKRAKRPTRTN